MSYHPRQNYLESQVLSASPVELVLLLYRGAIENLEAAVRHSERGDPRARNASAGRASEILFELTQSLDREQGGDLARQLIGLYDYALRRIQEGNFQAGPAAYREVIQLLTTLHDGWKQIIPPRDAEREDSSTGTRSVECVY